MSSQRWLEGEPTAMASSLRPSRTLCRTTHHSEPLHSQMNSSHLLVKPDPLQSPSLLSLAVSLPLAPSSSSSFPPKACMCSSHLSTHTTAYVTWTHPKRIVPKKKKTKKKKLQPFCIRKYFTLLCIMFLHNVYIDI